MFFGLFSVFFGLLFVSSIQMIFSYVDVLWSVLSFFGLLFVSSIQMIFSLSSWLRVFTFINLSIVRVGLFREEHDLPVIVLVTDHYRLLTVLIHHWFVCLSLSPCLHGYQDWPGILTLEPLISSKCWRWRCCLRIYILLERV